MSQKVMALILMGLLLLGSGYAAPDLSKSKKTAAESVERNSMQITKISKEIWELAELALNENQSSRLLADLLEQNGFQIERGVSGMPTAWVASYGSGKPVIAFLAEYDALPGLSQKVSAKVEARVPGAGGHGCGHSLFGAGSVGGALALKDAMERHGLKGTVRVYGTPAEEQGIGKVFMVRDNLFNDVDVCFSWHPSDENAVNVQPSKALRSFEVTFHGRSAHAAGAPWEGVSALDAVEAFTTGVNLLREHMPETGRIHYVVTEGGGAPNVIPAKASIWLFTRGKDWREEEKIYNHVQVMVQAADMMAWGEEYGDSAVGFRPAEIAMFTGLYDYNINREVAKIVQTNLDLAGPPVFTHQEQEFARALQKSFGVPASGYHTKIKTLDFERAPEPGGSTDVANISWVAPTVDFGVANWPLGIPAHSWASTSASGYSAAFKAMHQASKIMAFCGIDIMTDPKLLKKIREAFKESVKDFDYAPAVGPEDKPRLPSHMRER